MFAEGVTPPPGPPHGVMLGALSELNVLNPPRSAPPISAIAPSQLGPATPACCISAGALIPGLGAIDTALQFSRFCLAY